MSKTIGFIGLGIMGKPMALNLLKAGFSVCVLDHRQETTEELVTAGATVGGKLPREVAGGCDVLITMLPDPQTVELVLTGVDGVLQVAHPGLVVIDMSTTSPVLIRQLAASFNDKGATLLDAPVSGGDQGAIDASLSIMVGGDQTIFTHNMSIFEALGKTITYIGESGSGQIMKACNQIVIALTLEALGEALVLAEKSGVDPMQAIKVIGGGLAASRLLELRGPSMVARDFEPRGRIRTQIKDLDIILDLARTSGVSLPVTALVTQMFISLAARGRAELDHSAIMTYIEDLARS